MTDICDELDRVLLGSFVSDGIHCKGLCQLVLKGDQLHPVTVTDNKQVSIQDNWDALVFHRLFGEASFEESEEQDFGRTTGRTFIQPMRTMVAVKSKKGEEWIYSFAQGWPETLDVEDGGGLDLYEFVDINDMRINTDHEAIFNSEFGETSYEKHRIPWNIYAIEWNAQFKRC